MQTLFDRPREVVDDALDRIGSEKLSQEILVTDPTTLDEDDDRLAGQNLEAYRLLMLHGIMSNKELSARFLDYRGRIRDIRAYLRPKGQTVKCTRGTGGLAYYSIVRLDGPKRQITETLAGNGEQSRKTAK